MNTTQSYQISNTTLFDLTSRKPTFATSVRRKSKGNRRARGRGSWLPWVSLAVYGIGTSLFHLMGG